jgi:divalent metal cation (Fe/Co/Zn/Cd) transporter
VSTKDRIKEFLYKYKYVEKYLTDDIFQTQTMLLASLAMNIAAATFKFVMGVWFGSKWLVTVSIYFLTLSAMRLLLLNRERKSKKLETPEHKRLYDLKSYRACGYMVLFMNMIVGRMIVQMLVDNEGYDYPGLMLYLIGLFAIANFANAIYNVKKYWHIYNPMISAAKRLSFSTALVLLYTLQTSALARFGNNHEQLRRLLNSISGAVVELVLFTMAILMIVRSNQEMHKLKEG